MKGRKKKLSLYRSRNKRKRPTSSATTSTNTFRKTIVSYLYSTDSDSDNPDSEYIDIEASDSDENREDFIATPKRSKLASPDYDHEITFEEDNAHYKQFTEQCVEKLSCKEYWRDLVDKLYRSHNLNEFMLLLDGLKCDKIPMDNIVFLLMLERAKFGWTPNTCGMRYRKVTKTFWSIVYRLCKSTGLKFFSGSKNWGQVVCKESRKSVYHGDMAKINFAVPDEKMLRRLSKKFPKVIPPGIIHKSMDLLQNEKNIILMADGKMVTKGLGDNFTGDVNLFGHEENPNVKALEDELWNYVCFISDSVTHYENVAECDRLTNIIDIENIITNLIQRIRLYMMDKKKKLLSYDENNTFNTKIISKLKTDIYTASLWIKKILQLNVKLMHLMAAVQTNSNMFSDLSPVIVNMEGNIRMLHKANYVAQHVDFEDFPHLFKKGSDIYRDLLHQSCVPAKYAYYIMGLDTRSNLRHYYSTYISEETPYPPEQNSEHTSHLDAIATTCKLFMPSYMPSCCLFYEEGIRFMDGRITRKLLSCGPLGIIRHHHGIQKNQLLCNTKLNLEHDNYCVVINTDPCCINNAKFTHKPGKSDSVNCLLTMRITKTMKCLFVTVGVDSVAFCEVTFNNSVWKRVIKHIKLYYDREQPSMPDKLGTVKVEMNMILEDYINECCSVFCELPKIQGIEHEVEEPTAFSAYMKMEFIDKVNTSVLLEDDFETLTYDICRLIEEGFNHLRLESSEILAFVATNSDRIQVKGIPPHLPVAYGLRGHSMTTTTMRSMLNEILSEFDKREISILCEVYDGQFHKLITRSKDGQPLTRLQFQQDFFKKIMKDYDKKELVHELMKYSDIYVEDLEEIRQKEFEDCILELESITLSMHRQANTRKFLLCSNDVCNVTFADFKTRYRAKLWNKLLSRYSTQPNSLNTGTTLTNNELMDIIRGTRFHRQQMFATGDNDDITSDSESDDPDYEPSNLIEESSESDGNEDTNISLLSNLSTASTTSHGESCISKMLDTLKKLKKNKHNWKTHTLNSFLREFLSSKQGISKLFLYELDVINKQVKESYGKELFNPKDRKNVRVDKISNQLRKIPNLFTSETPDVQEVFQPRTLKDMYLEYVLSKYYPKEFLAAAYCELHNMEEVKKWEQTSKINLQIHFEEFNLNHIAFNYPEYNTERKKLEMRTFDYTHILNNLRFHICNKGLTDVKTEAFIKISDENNDILPRAIVEDKLDRQNASISMRFFSEDVESCLRKLNYNSEANFVCLTRNWFNACDKRGISACERMNYLYAMYQYLLSLYTFSEYPPQSTHISGIPVRTYEALLHTISTRFLLYSMCTTKSFNNRAVSTLAIESFFSDLNRYEFSGLGAPKSVDIPKLISHVVHINTTKHDPRRGFEFTTSTRDNYPCYLMEIEQSTDNMQVLDHPFDKKIKNKKSKTKKFFSLSKPKQITKGGRGIRQFFKIDETRLTDEQRFGKKINISEII